MTPTSSILETNKVTFAYGGVRALSDCSLSIARERITGLVGPNGAGKSTLINVVSGGLRPDSGSVLFDGVDITGWSRASIARLGIIRSFQLSREFAQLPVIENVMLAAQGQAGEALSSAVLFRGRWKSQERHLRERASELLDWIGLLGHELIPAGSLSGGQRRLLDIARALMAKPKLLLLDEPTAGVYPVAARLIATRLRELPGQGVTILVVAHDMDFIAGVCDEVVAMAQGSVLIRGSLEDVRRSPELAEAYLGG